LSKTLCVPHTNTQTLFLSHDVCDHFDI